MPICGHLGYYASSKLIAGHHALYRFRVTVCFLCRTLRDTPKPGLVECLDLDVNCLWQREILHASARQQVETLGRF